MSGLPGVIEAKASCREGNVVVRYDPAVITPAEIAGAIATETYYTVGEPVAGGELDGGAAQAAAGAIAVIEVEGMTDERTATLVTQALGTAGPAVSLPGDEPPIIDVAVDVTQARVTVTFDADRVSAQELVDAIREGTQLQASLVSVAGVEGGGVDYTPYIVLGIAGLFAAALAWPAFSWVRRQIAHATAQSRATRRRAQRRRR